MEIPDDGWNETVHTNGEGHTEEVNSTDFTINVFKKSAPHQEFKIIRKCLW